MNDPLEFVESPIKTLAIFDVCDTLYTENTTFGFVRYVMRGRKIFSILDATITSSLSPVFVAFTILKKMTDNDYVRNIYLSYLSGIKRSKLDLAADAYVKEVLEPLAINWTQAKLKEALSKGQTVYLASSSIDCVVKAIARRTGAQFFSSNLEYVGETCSGKLASDMTGKKMNAIADLPNLKLGFTRIRVFTDNFTDIELVKTADEATIILPGGRGRKKWTGCDVDFVNV